MALFDHRGMNAVPAVPEAESDPEALFHDVIASGWLRLIVPKGLGGEGASVAEVAEALRPLARRHPAAGWVAWAQGLAVEALVRSPNVAVRETVLPYLLDGTRAGAVSWAPVFMKFGEDAMRFQLIFDLCEDLRIESRLQRQIPNYFQRLIAFNIKRPLRRNGDLPDFFLTNAASSTSVNKVTQRRYFWSNIKLPQQTQDSLFLSKFWFFNFR